MAERGLRRAGDVIQVDLAVTDVLGSHGFVDDLLFLTEAFLSFPLVTAWAATISVFTLSFLMDFELTEFGGAIVTAAYAPVLVATRRAKRATIMAGDGRIRCIETLLALFASFASIELGRSVVRR